MALNARKCVRSAHALSCAGLIFCLAAASFMILIASADQSPAQAQSCRALKAQLASLDRRGSGGANRNYQKWSNSVAEQRQAIRRTERQSRAGRCGSGSAHAQCQQIQSTLKRMRANLTKLERRRDRYADAGGNRRAKEKRAIERQLRRNGCYDRPRQRTASRDERREIGSARARGSERGFINPRTGRREGFRAPRRDERREGRRERGLLSMLFGRPVDRAGDARRDRSRYGRRDDYQRRLFARTLPPDEDFIDDFSGGIFMGTYRTMCVRRCDGYYFPISFSTTEDMFGRDAALCSQMCPSGNAELFVHENPGGTPESMTSVDGISYTELPNAFQYRRKFDKACTCQTAPRGRITTLSRLHVQNGVLQTRRGRLDGGIPSAPRPLAKRSPDLDPDERINLVGRYTPPRKRVENQAIASGSPTIRIVGPNYFYAQ